MEIDLDNLVFNGLEEAQERNAERLEDADKKAQAIVADDACGDACKIYPLNRQSCRFFCPPRRPPSALKASSARLSKKIFLRIRHFTNLTCNFFLCRVR